MKFRLVIILLAVALGSLSKSKSNGIFQREAKQYLRPRECNGLMQADCYDNIKGMSLLMRPAGRSRSRNLRTVGFISYDALRKDSIPCNRRGNSYYNCNERGKANPYRRGCSAITHCARSTD